MKITIVGAGNMGRGIATRMIAGGHDVTIIDRAPDKAQALADTINADATGAGTATAGSLEAIDGDVIVLATYYPGNLELAREIGGGLDDRIVVDIANPIDMSDFSPATVPGSSSAEELAAAAPNAHVVKAFNTTFAGTLVAGEVAGHPVDVFIAGDDQAAKDTIASLVSDGGLVPVDVGPLAHSRQLEGLGYLGIMIQQPLGHGFDTGWKLLTPR